MKLRCDERAVLLWLALASLVGASFMLWRVCESAADWIARAPERAGGGL